MVLLSTGSLCFIRNERQVPLHVAFMPRNVRNAVPIGGGSLIVSEGPYAGAAQGRLDLHEMHDLGRAAGQLEPLHRLFLAAQERL